MPIENEVKFVLRPDALLEAALAEAGSSVEIQQTYLGGGCRVRRTRAHDGVEHMFTFKKPLRSGASVEIEAAIGKRDYDLLVEDAVLSLSKRRFKCADGHVQWDIDLFHGLSGTAFAMAEAEMPEGMKAPPRILPLIAPWILHAVERGDDRFSSYRLCESGHADGLLRDIGGAD